MERQIENLMRFREDLLPRTAHLIGSGPWRRVVVRVRNRVDAQTGRCEIMIHGQIRESLGLKWPR